MHAVAESIELRNATLASWGAQPVRLCGLAGLAGLGAGLIVGLIANDGLKAISFSYVISFAFFLGISVAALIFIGIQHVTRAAWSVVIRRIAESLAWGVLPLAVLFLPILLPVLIGASPLYSWNDAETVAQSTLLQNKAPYLNAGFFAVRWVIYFAIWAWLARRFWDLSARQDDDGEVAWTIRAEALSAPALLLLALSITFAAFDLLMSLDPLWFSTIFGVYYFAGSMVAFLATVTLVIFGLQRSGIFPGVFTVEHQHDVGKLMFGFNCFWAYVAFSQYMLTWYANIPEETRWFLARQSNGWEYISIVLIIGHFVLPFLGFMSRWIKRSRTGLAFWAVWLLVMHWIDLYWLAVPVRSPEGLSFGLTDVCAFVGVGGIYFAGILKCVGTRSLIPARDPRLPESLQFHNI